jgi:hypothetical protein
MPIGVKVKDVRERSIQGEVCTAMCSRNYLRGGGGGRGREGRRGKGKGRIIVIGVTCSTTILEGRNIMKFIMYFE